MVLVHGFLCLTEWTAYIFLTQKHVLPLACIFYTEFYDKDYSLQTLEGSFTLTTMIRVIVHDWGKSQYEGIKSVIDEHGTSLGTDLPTHPQIRASYL